MEVASLSEMVAQRFLGVSSASTQGVNMCVAGTFVFLAKYRDGLILILFSGYFIVH